MTSSKYSRFLRQQFNFANRSPTNDAAPSDPSAISANGLEGIRYADTVEGRLCQRDPDILKRYLLDAPTFEERERRQEALFFSASSDMAIAPTVQRVPGCSVYPGAQDSQSAGVVQCGLFCLPVVFTSARAMNVFARLPLDQPSSRTFTRELQDVILQSSPALLTSARIESLISMDELLGVSPLTAFLAVSNETKRHAGTFNARPCEVAAKASETVDQKRRLLESNWSLRPAQSANAIRPVGPYHPVAYLMVMFCTWDAQSARPDIRQISPTGKFQLQELLRTYLAKDQTNNHGETGHTGNLERIRLSVGSIAPIHHAISDAQGLQLQMAAQRAREVGLEFQISHGQIGSEIHWKASIQGQDADGDPIELTVADCSYDSTWRSDRHVDQIQQCLQDRPAKYSDSQNGQAHLALEQNEVHFDKDGKADEAHQQCIGLNGLKAGRTRH